MSKTVLITGASRGIGAACAQMFAEHDYNVVVNYNYSKTQAYSIVRDIIDGLGRAIAVKADVSNPCEVHEMFEIARNHFGKIDVLVNNAAISEQKLISDITITDFSRMMDVNIGGVFNCSKEAVSDMLPEKYGNIVNISSMYGITGASCETHYSASKAAVIGFTKALALELAPSGIRVNCIAPGIIRTDMNAHLSEDDMRVLQEGTPLQTLGTPSDIASMAVYLASDQARFITGAVININGGIV